MSLQKQNQRNSGQQSSICSRSDIYIVFENLVFNINNQSSSFFTSLYNLIFNYWNKPNSVFTWMRIKYISFFFDSFDIILINRNSTFIYITCIFIIISYNFTIGYSHFQTEKLFFSPFIVRNFSNKLKYKERTILVRIYNLNFNCTLK